MMCHHGTMLLNVDLGKMAEYLTPNSAKMEVRTWLHEQSKTTINWRQSLFLHQSKGLKSVRSRVTNLSLLDPSISHEVVSHAITQRFLRAYGAAEDVLVRPRLSYSTANTLTTEDERERVPQSRAWEKKREHLTTLLCGFLWYFRWKQSNQTKLHSNRLRFYSPFTSNSKTGTGASGRLHPFSISWRRVLRGASWCVDSTQCDHRSCYAIIYCHCTVSCDCFFFVRIRVSTLPKGK